MKPQPLQQSDLYKKLRQMYPLLMPVVPGLELRVVELSREGPVYEVRHTR